MVRQKRQPESRAADFFISYTSVDQAWAEWIAVQLETAGYVTWVQAWDFRPGSDFIHAMEQATSTAQRTVAVLSPAYFGSQFGEAEWRVAFASDPTGELGLLVPVRVQECQLPGLLAGRVYIDLVDTDEATARQRLLAGVGRSGAQPATATFPGAVGGMMRFPGRGPEINNLPARNRDFLGREELLEQLHNSLRVESAAAVVPTTAVAGLGGVGKTQLVLEYAHRFGSDYGVVWWIAADQALAISGQLAALARRLGLPEVPDQEEQLQLLWEELGRRDRWLLIYDNAERPDRLMGLLPPSSGRGHVLVTSRWSAWAGQATPFRLSTLSRSESIMFLRQRTGSDDQAALDALAELLGDLPLALEEAAAYLEETRISLVEYLQLVRERARELFGLQQSSVEEHRDQQRVATTWSLALDQVHHEAPAAEALLSLCALLAPDIPRELPREQPKALPRELARAVRDPLAYNRMLAVVGRYSLAVVSPTSLHVHRLVQAVIQDRLGKDGEGRWAEVAVGVLRESYPDESWEVATWPTCERLLPHALAAAGHAERLQVAGEQTGWLLERAATYLRERGQYRQAKPIAERALAITEAALGPNNPTVTAKRSNLGRILHDLGDLVGARLLFEQALTVDEATLGPDHPDVALDRNNLGLVLLDLGDPAGARSQLEQALAVDEMSLGPDHPRVATARNNLGSMLLSVGDLDAARSQYQRALTIAEAALGPEHPMVATILNNLGRVLVSLGDLTQARALYARALAIDERVYGQDHPQVASDRAAISQVLQGMGNT
jgi:tetratricopeptide (TPR) repeat protein